MIKMLRCLFTLYISECLFNTLALFEKFFITFFIRFVPSPLTDGACIPFHPLIYFLKPNVRMIRMKNILLIKSISRYGSLDRYIDEWADAIRKMGCNTCVLDGWSLAQPQLFHHVISSYRFDVVIDINVLISSWDVLQNLPSDTIYATYLCDPAFCFRKELQLVSDRTIVFTCDNNFRQFVTDHFPAIHHAEFIPLSGSACPISVPYEERTIDILFTGTYENPINRKKQLLSRFEKSPAMSVFLNDMLEDIIANPEFTLPECLSRTLEKYHVAVSDNEFAELAEEFFNVDYYARFYYREKVIHSLLDAGLTIHVFGSGWESFPTEHRENLIIHEGGVYAAQKALANTKIALNIMPWFKDAFQERIASAMLSKAVAVTDESKYILENFRDNKELVIFSLRDTDALARRIKNLLEHPQDASNLAEAGYKKIQDHTWYCRVYDMLRQIELHFNTSLIQEGHEGRRLELETTYPNSEAITLDAIYELEKMAAFAQNNLSKVPDPSSRDFRLLLDQFEYFTSKFSKYFDGMEMSAYIQDCLRNPSPAISPHLAELFSLQCRALIGKLTIDSRDLKL